MPVVADEDVEVSIVVKVADGGAPAHASNGEIRAELITDVLKDASPWCETSLGSVLRAPW